MFRELIRFKLSYELAAGSIRADKQPLMIFPLSKS
jgi:hypothetical protein